jgi:hypothetical protein
MPAAQHEVGAQTNGKVHPFSTTETRGKLASPRRAAVRMDAMQ